MSFKENELFRPIFGHRLNACVGNNGGPYDLYDYALGYFESTRMLFDAAKAPGVIIDVAVYPICFDFRHAIELYIKYVINDLGRVKGTGQQYRTGHTLLRNWKKAKKLLSAIDHSAEDAKLFEDIVRCVEEVDPSGQTFRYPESIKYDQHLKDWSVINLAVLEHYYAMAFRIARDWHHRIEGAVEHASQNGSLAPAYKQALGKNAFAAKWHHFLHLMKTAGQQTKVRLKSKRRL